MINPILPVYATFNRSFVKGDGIFLYDNHGKQYYDFACGYGVTGLGHSHPHLIAALDKQSREVWHISNMFQHPERDRLARRLVDSTFADTVFFTNSGVEAWELGLKMCRRYHYSKGKPNKTRLIVMEEAFHGRTMAAISAAPRPYMIDGFGPLVEGFDVVPIGNLNELRAAITDETAAIHFEPVMGEAGIRPQTMEYMQEARKICDEFGLLLFLDEIQCGVGRTGKYFAHEWAGIKPDIVCTAKGIGGGFPLGALFATEEAGQCMIAGTHGTTYGGNPLAMAVGNAVLDLLLEPEFFPHVQKMGDVLDQELHKLVEKYPQLFTETRGLGLMRGLVCADGVNNRKIIEAMQEQGVISIPAGTNVVRFLPPLVITEDQICAGIKIIDDVCANYKAA